MLTLTLPITALIYKEFKKSDRWPLQARDQEPVGPGTDSGPMLDGVHVLKGQEWMEVGEGV